MKAGGLVYGVGAEGGPTPEFGIVSPEWVTGGCNIFRSGPALSETYQVMATAACAHPCFSSAPECFGTQAIIETAANGGAIKGPQKATEARINIHMTIQSGASGTMPVDEIEYTD